MSLEQIDTSTTAGKAYVMQLAADGRRVAYTTLGRREWQFARNPKWNWMERDYDIISEPVGPEEVWVTISPGGEAIATHRSAPGWLPSNSRGQVATAVRYIRADLAGEKG